jgi:dipeptidyl aminopeptidase/acylaminoacyl peptidase
MTTNHEFDRQLADWLHESSAHRVPDHVTDVLLVTRATRQRSWWSSLERWLPMDLAVRTRTIVPPRLGRVLVVAAVLIALVVASLYLLGAGSRRLPPPFGLAANGAIVSWSNGDIFVTDSDGNHLRPLVGGPTNDEGPLLTRDGTRMAYWRIDGPNDSTLMLANVDGTGSRPVLDHALQHADWYEWSPGDDRLAIVNTVGGRRVISIADVATGAIRDLAVPGLEVDNDVVWRPADGRELLFTARPIADSPRGAKLLAIRPDGTGLRTILEERPFDWAYLGLTVAPDGKTGSYWMYEPTDGSPDLHARVHLFGVDTGVDTVQQFDPANVDESELQWSPDGTLGLIVSATTRAHVQVIAFDGSAPIRTLGPAFRGDEDKSVGWSPDGTSVILHFDNGRPSFIEGATGDIRTADGAWGRVGGWQRVAR